MLNKLTGHCAKSHNLQLRPPVGTATLCIIRVQQSRTVNEFKGSAAG